MAKNFLEGVQINLNPDLDVLRKSLFHADEMVFADADGSYDAPTMDLVYRLTGSYFDHHRRHQTSVSTSAVSLSTASSTTHYAAAKRALRVANDCFGNPNLVQHPRNARYPDCLRMILVAMEIGTPALSIGILRHAIEHEIREGSPYAARILLRILLLAIIEGKVEYSPHDVRHRGHLQVVFHLMCRYDPSIEQIRVAHQWCGLLFEQRGIFIDTTFMHAEFKSGKTTRAEEMHRFIMWTYGKDHADDIMEQFMRDEDQPLRNPMVPKRFTENTTISTQINKSGKTTVIIQLPRSSLVEIAIQRYFKDGVESFRQQMHKMDHETLQGSIQQLVQSAPTFEYLATVLEVAQRRELRLE